MLPNTIKIVLFDMAGTTVDDRATGSSLVIDAFIAAFAEHGIKVDRFLVNRYRGIQKYLAVREIIGAMGLAIEEEAAGQIYRSFLAAMKVQVPKMKAMAGAAAVFRFLRARGIRVGLGSGFPADLVAMIGAHLGWQEGGRVDYLESSESLGVSRPDPRMIYQMMERFGVTDPRQVVKVGDTVADVGEGKNAGAWTVAVLTGSQSRAELEAAGPDFVLPGVEDIPSLFGE